MNQTALYEDDIVTWSEQQAAALRALAVRPELSNIVDWENVIEEIETLGRSEWRGVESQIRNALVHVVKGFCDPDSPSRGAWAIETGNFLQEARQNFRPSMRHKMDVDAIWSAARERAERELLAYRRRIPPGLPARSPFALDEMLEPSFEYQIARRLYDALDTQH